MSDPDTMAQADQTHLKMSMRKVALTALAGTSIEWYDFFLYATAAALVFPSAFFPGSDPTIGLVLSFGTFAFGFIARPLGGIIFGHFGDRVGRKKTLVIALWMMGISSTLIGLLPTYATIGVAAPIILCLLRFAQGLAIGGQWGGAMLLVTESAPAEKRGFYGAFAQAGAPVGVILANVAFLIVTASVSTEALLDWGWRIPFLASIILIGLSLYVQLTLEDTPAFKELIETTATSATKEAKPRSPVIQALKSYPKEITLAAGAFLGVQVTFYILIVFVISYGTDPAGLALGKSDMLFAVLISTMFQIPALFFFASWSDRHGRRGIYKWGAIVTGLWAFVMFPLINTGSLPLIILALAGGQVAIAMMYGPQAALLTELFSTEVRYSGASLGYQLGAIVGGGFAPIIATSLVAFGSTVWVSGYIACACALTYLSLVLLKETTVTDLDKVA